MERSLTAGGQRDSTFLAAVEEAQTRVARLHDTRRGEHHRNSDEEEYERDSEENCNEGDGFDSEVEGASSVSPKAADNNFTSTAMVEGATKSSAQPLKVLSQRETGVKPWRLPMEGQMSQSQRHPRQVPPSEILVIE